MTDKLSKSALEYHRAYPPGKLQIVATKALATQRDLALAYSPGVAAACEAIVENPLEAATVTARGNLVAVVSNGTAVLGMGAIGALASKPVMEGKAVLYKKFAGVDVFDIEIDETDPELFAQTVARLEPTFGGINLEDIKAPECFTIERALRERMRIPVFHDDQHGTAIVVCAAVINALKVVGKDIIEAKLVSSGAGAAALSCLDLLVSLGLPQENITITDRSGVVSKNRAEYMDPYKARFAQETDALSLSDAIVGTDIFLGLSVGGVLKPHMVESMAERPIIMALANPTPEILPEEAKAVRPDAVIATGRSDYPNQVNNVLCFPFLFRGALDVGATEINDEMKKACVQAIAELALAEASDVVLTAYGTQSLQFGPEYLIPKPFDPRLIVKVAPKVAKAAMDSGVATRPISDFEAYEGRLTQFVFRSGMVMKPVFEAARRQPRRVVYAEGEDERVLQAVQQVVDEGLAHPILLARTRVISTRLNELGLRIRPGRDFELVDPQHHAHYERYWKAYHTIMEREGLSPEEAREHIRTRSTVLAAMMLRMGDADAMLCGAMGRFKDHLLHIVDTIGRAEGVRRCSTMCAMILPTGTFFICDTHVMPNPSAEEIAELAMLCAVQVRRFGITPKVALLSYSNFGTSRRSSPRKMRRAKEILDIKAPDLEVEGEMHADAALSAASRKRLFPNSRLQGQANLLVMPNLNAANITYNMLKMLGQGVSIGPILVGAAQPAHIIMPTTSVRGLLNMTALAVVDAQSAASAPASI